MTAVLERRGLIHGEDSFVPKHVLEVIEDHVRDLEGLPTPELVETICKELPAPTDRSKVVYYFLVESPLRPIDLVRSCRTFSAAMFRLVGTQAARKRAYRLRDDRLPRWR